MLPILQFVRAGIPFFPPWSPTFLPDPFTDVGRTIFQLDVVYFAISQKLDCIAVYECYVLQIEGDVATGTFQLEESSQLVRILCLDSTAQSKQDPSIGLPLNLEHLNST
ncbi:MAG TPA: hypothetical protein VK829_12910 [Terriglobales bacterium]|nr:hypothetical protein [Terriglobales bacterium]